MTDYLHALPPGYRIDEYELVRVLGSGGFGITYLGYDHHLDKAVAIKEYLPNDLAVRTDNQSVLPKSTEDKVDYEWGLERFLNEAQTLARFDHRHIIRIHRFFRAHGTGYSVMEYAEGETLSALLQRKGTLTEAELKHILFPILDGLEVVHEADFLHRDIKPGNIVIRDDGSPVLIDFGSARQAVAGKSRSVTAIVTPGYAPVEQYSVKGHQGAWTDIYGLGAVCYRCLSGEAPDDATERLRADPLIPAIQRCEGRASAELLAAIDRALRVDERERPQSIKEWRSELERTDDADSGCFSKDDDIPVAKIQQKDRDLGWDNSAEISSDDKSKSSPSRIATFVWILGVLVVIVTIIAIIIGGIITNIDGRIGSDDIIADIPIRLGEAELSPKALASTQWSQLTLDIQTILSALGYNPGTVDGIYGERTRAAIEAFQQDISIPVDGQISQQLFHTLQQSLRISQIFDDMLDVDTNDNSQSTTNVDNSSDEEVRTTDTTPTTQNNRSSLTGTQEKYFTRGSHEDDVLRLQGTPSSINRYSNSETWRYGLSTVEIDLQTRRVLEWSNTSGNLNVRLLPGKQVTSEAYFTRGSHEDEVLRLQGTPSSINRYSNSETWRYGLSTVEIDLRTRRVLEWSNTSGNLKVRL